MACTSIGPRGIVPGGCLPPLSRGGRDNYASFSPTARPKAEYQGGPVELGREPSSVTLRLSKLIVSGRLNDTQSATLVASSLDARVPNVGAEVVTKTGGRMPEEIATRYALSRDQRTQLANALQQYLNKVRIPGEDHHHYTRFIAALRAQ